MMKVELTKKISWGGIFRKPGDTLTGPEHLMRTLVAEGNAVVVEDKKTDKVTAKPAPPKSTSEGS